MAPGFSVHPPGLATLHVDCCPAEPPVADRTVFSLNENGIEVKKVAIDASFVRRRCVTSRHESNVMFSYGISIAVLITSLVSISASQLMIKWRFGVLGQDIEQRNGYLEKGLFVVSDLWLWVAGVLAVTGIVTWYVAMTRLPISFMFPAAALATPLVTLAAFALLNEPLTLAQFAVILVITASVVTLGFLQ